MKVDDSWWLESSEKPILLCLAIGAALFVSSCLIPQVMQEVKNPKRLQQSLLRATKLPSGFLRGLGKLQTFTERRMAFVPQGLLNMLQGNLSSWPGSLVTAWSIELWFARDPVLPLDANRVVQSLVQRSIWRVFRYIQIPAYQDMSDIPVTLFLSLVQKLF